MAQKHVFVGKKTSQSEVRCLNHLRGELDEGYWAAHCSIATAISK